MANFSTPYCPFCGKLRPMGHGGCGPCSCSGYRNYFEESARRSRLEAEERERAREQERKSRLSRYYGSSCVHEFVGSSPVSGGCIKCGMTVAEYRQLKGW